MRIRDPDTGRDVAMFAEAHQRLLHLFIIGRDLQYFAHEHPERTARGFELATPLPPGAYMVIADFVPGGGYPQMVHRAIVTPGYRASPFAGAPQLDEDLSDKLREGMRIQLRVEADRGRPEAVLRFRFVEADTGAPITDLQPYLGAAGHVLIVSPDLDALGARASRRQRFRPGSRRPRRVPGAGHVQAVDSGAAGRQGGVGAVHRADRKPVNWRTGESLRWRPPSGGTAAVEQIRTPHAAFRLKPEATLY